MGSVPCSVRFRHRGEHMNGMKRTRLAGRTTLAVLLGGWAAMVMSCNDDEAERGRDNVAIIKHMYDELLAQGSVQPFIDTFAEDGVLKLTIPQDTPISGEFRGKDGLRTYFERVDQVFASEEIRFDDFIAHGDQVIVLGFERGRVKPTGKTLPAPSRPPAATAAPSGGSGSPLPPCVPDGEVVHADGPQATGARAGPWRGTWACPRPSVASRVPSARLPARRGRPQEAGLEPFHLPGRLVGVPGPLPRYLAFRGSYHLPGEPEGGTSSHTPQPVTGERAKFWGFWPMPTKPPRKFIRYSFAKYFQRKGTFETPLG
jgi:ketosteroid isomerase-like protein